MNKHSLERSVKTHRPVTTKFESEEKIRILLAQLRREEAIAELCKRDATFNAYA
jgi:hypothetical protein